MSLQGCTLEKIWCILEDPTNGNPLRVGGEAGNRVSKNSFLEVEVGDQRSDQK